MEFIKNTAARFGSLSLIVCLAFLGTMAFSSCDNKDEEDEDGYRTFKSAFDLKFTRVERVGSVLIADFTLKNKSGKDIRNFALSTRTAIDNQGKEYYYNDSKPLLSVWNRETINLELKQVSQKTKPLTGRSELAISIHLIQQGLSS